MHARPQAHREKLVVTASRGERVYKRTGEPSVTFCGRGGATERYEKSGSTEVSPDCEWSGTRSDVAFPVNMHARPQARREKLVVTASRGERVYKRAGEPSVTFCGRGGATERYEKSGSTEVLPDCEWSGIRSDVALPVDLDAHLPLGIPRTKYSPRHVDSI